MTGCHPELPGQADAGVGQRPASAWRGSSRGGKWPRLRAHVGGAERTLCSTGGLKPCFRLWSQIASPDGRVQQARWRRLGPSEPSHQRAATGSARKSWSLLSVCSLALRESTRAGRPERGEWGQDEQAPQPRGTGSEGDGQTECRGGTAGRPWQAGDSERQDVPHSGGRSGGEL